MRVLVIGSGGREHALCWALARSPHLTALYCAPGNAGTAEIAENVALDPMDFAACAEWAVRNSIDLTVVGPDDPLGGGIADVFTARGLLVFGPSKAAARIESSKVWAKQLMLEAGVPTARAEHFDDYSTASSWLDSYTAQGGDFPVVVKADGLAAGKGVVVAETPEEARAALDELLRGGRLGDAGATVLIEEFLRGPEVSLFAVADRERIVPLAPACDYKRAFDGDEGPNTGGMGTYSPPGFVSPALLAQVERTILRPTVTAMARAGAPFCGLLYAGLVLTDEGPKVLEFNARFGDPETQVVLPRLQSDLLELCLAVAHGRLDEAPAPIWRDEAACGVVLASSGYPGPFERGKTITGLDSLDPDVLVFQAGTLREPGGQLVTTGGRVMTLVALGPTVAAARERVYANVDRVTFDGVWHRTDIAAREVVADR